MKTISIVDGLKRHNVFMCDMLKDLRCSNVSNNTLNWLGEKIEDEIEMVLDKLHDEGFDYEA